MFTTINDTSPLPTAFAAAVEERGFESLFLPEHTHIPVNVNTPYPASGPIPPGYARNFDPFVALAAAAAVTERIRLGTAVLLPAQRDPIVTAKEVASLDVLSNGRFELGVGVGWLREEVRNHGTDPARRVAVALERLAAMERIWNDDAAAFHGDHVDFDPVQAWPKPVQRPRPPVLWGGWGPTTFLRIVVRADGWLAPPGLDPERVDAGIAELRGLAVDEGHARPTVVATVNDPTPGLLAELAGLGVDRALVSVLDSSPTDRAWAGLDQVAAAAAHFLSPIGAPPVTRPSVEQPETW